MANYKAKGEELADEVRDWAVLPTDILNLIISRLYFPAEISRFHGVCTAWKSVPAPLVRSQWLMSKPPIGTRLNFFHPLYCKPYSMEIPELEFAKVRFSKDGWLLMSDGDINFFYNPFTRAKVELPNLPQGYNGLFKNNRFKMMTFTAPPTSSDCAVFGVNSLFDEVICISTIVRGEGSWKICRFQNNVPMFPSPCSPVICNGLLYCLGRDGKLGVFDREEGKWTVLDKPEKAPFNSVYENFLMECEGDIMSVFVGTEGFKRCAKVSVCRLDRLKMEWQEIKELGDKMLFLSDSTCLSATSHIPGMENKIYFPVLPRLHGRYGVFYTLATGMHQTFGIDFWSTDLGDTRELLNCSWIEPRDGTYSETQLDWLKNP
ncbi:hypothetical protein RJ640_004475 [Escallonia rubra]|uniref:KIB1-4 beta-propeller domain-containing protein n=1 Tax=Escallonia rubra TaxID=112253 RepID=A0AA88UU54_9ASTE|nr:hypothetical protein RJ640_004475 [Escallonia rubra]